MAETMKCRHIIEGLEAFDIDDEGNGYYCYVWACENCGEEFPEEYLIRFFKSGNGTIH